MEVREGQAMEVREGQAMDRREGQAMDRREGQAMDKNKSRKRAQPDNLLNLLRWAITQAPLIPSVSVASPTCTNS